MRTLLRTLALLVVVLLAGSSVSAASAAASAPSAVPPAAIAAEPGGGGLCGAAGAVGLGDACDAAAGALGDAVSGGVDAAEGAVDSVDGVRDAVGETVEFLSDPLEYLASAAQDGARSLATEVLPAMQSALQPDLSAEWWVDAYMVTFALAILVWVLQVLWAFVQTARGQLGPDGLAQVIGERTPLFFLGALFGPAAGVFLLSVTGALTRSIIEIFLGDGSADGASATGLGDLIEDTNPSSMPGGDFVALIVFSVMALGLLCVVVTLAIMLVTLYLSGIAFPLVWSWVTNPQHAAMGWKVVHVWVGILLTQPLMFLMLGGAIRLASSTLLEGQIPGASEGAGAGVRTLVALLVGTVALWMAALTPVMLTKFAPIMPGGPAEGGVGLRDLKPSGGGALMAGSLAAVSGRAAGGGSRSGAAAAAGAGAKGDPSGGRALEASLRSTGTGSGAAPGDGAAGGRSSETADAASSGGLQGSSTRGGSSESGARGMGLTGAGSGPGGAAGGAGSGRQDGGAGSGQGEQGLVGVSSGSSSSGAAGGSGGRHNAPVGAPRPGAGTGVAPRRPAGPTGGGGGTPGGGSGAGGSRAPLPTPRTRDEGGERR